MNGGVRPFSMLRGNVTRSINRNSKPIPEHLNDGGINADDAA